MRRLVLATVRLYQMSISPYTGSSCRHDPSCSAYAHEAITRYGALKGVSLAARRLARCRPFGSHGYDPVP